MDCRPGFLFRLSLVLDNYVYHSLLRVALRVEGFGGDSCPQDQWNTGVHVQGLLQHWVFTGYFQVPNTEYLLHVSQRP